MTDVPMTEVSDRVQVFLETASQSLQRSVDELCRILSLKPDQRSVADEVTFSKVTGIADELLRRRRYTPSIVDGFYANARKGHQGESTFIGGLQALEAHGYKPEAVESLSAAVAQRFLGLGNVWRGIDALGPVRFLDVGCGAGVDMGVAHHLSAGRSIVVGVDSRRDLLGFAAEAVPSSVLVVAHANALPFKDESFDVVVANGLPPLQRPSTMSACAHQLCSVTARGGRVAASVLVVAPALLDHLAGVFPDFGQELLHELATLATGKPTADDIQSAFIAAGAQTVGQIGHNPYRDGADRSETAMLEVVAIPQ